MSKFKVGDAALYNSMIAGKVLGKIVGFGHDVMGDFVSFRVTSRKKPGYPHGTVHRFYTETFLHPREVRK